MTIELRITLIVASLLTLIFVVRKIRNSKIKLEDSIFLDLLCRINLCLESVPSNFLCTLGYCGDVCSGKFCIPVLHFCFTYPELQSKYANITGGYEDQRINSTISY